MSPAQPRARLPILIALAVVGVLAFWTVSRAMRSEHAAASSAPLQPAPVAAAASAPARPAAGQSRTIQPTDPGSIFAPPTDPVQEALEHKRIVADYERKFRAEVVDAKWAAKAEPAINQILQDSGLMKSGIKAGDYRSSCRSHTCEISAMFKTSSDADDWATMYITNTGEVFNETNHMIIPRDDGTYEARIYGFRRQ